MFMTNSNKMYCNDDDDEMRRRAMGRKKVVIILREKSLKLRSEGERRLDDDPS